MMTKVTKDVTLGSDAREKINKGVNVLAEAVKATLGPKGRNVVIEGDSRPHVTKDGVTVAKHITLKDSIENIGAQLIKQAASKTGDVAGDGTTTATVLAQELIKKCNKSIAAEAAPIELKRGMDEAASNIVQGLKELSLKVDDDWKKIHHVATISANNDIKIGDIISEAFQKVGVDGVISVQNSSTTESYVEVVKGMQFDRGYLSPYFVTETAKMVCEYDNPLILLVDGKISSMRDIIPVVDKAAKAKQPLLIIAEDIDPQTMSMLVVNRMRNNFPVVAVKSPAFGERKKQILQDIAILTGANVSSQNTALPLDQVTLDDLGTVEKIKITKDSTTLIGSGGDQDEISKRIKELKYQLKKEDSKWVQEKIQERIGKLGSGIAIIKVGGVTETEVKEVKDRIDDSLNATRAAIAEGISPGGGLALPMVLELFETQTNNGENERTKDYERGMEIVKESVWAPLMAISENAGKSGEVIRQKVLDYNTKVKEISDVIGYNARTDNFENLIDSGVIDPTMVARISLESAVSVAGNIITTECAITNNYGEAEMDYDPELINSPY